MQVDGQCHCGEITYVAEIDPRSVGICHCSDCQVFSGSAYRPAVRAIQGSFVLRSGQPKLYVKTADSGAKRAHAFCANCGSPVYSTAAADPQQYTLRIGGLRQRAELTPRVQLWCQSALPWAMDLSGIPKLPRQ